MSGLPGSSVGPARAAALVALLALAAPAFAQDGAAAGGATAAPASAATSPTGDSLLVVLFNSRTCARGCTDVDEAMPAVVARWGGRVDVRTHYVDIGADDPETYALFVLYDRHYEANVQNTPVAYVGESVLVGAEAILDRLDEAIASELVAGGVTYVPAADEMASLRRGAEDGAQVLMDRMSIASVTGAGLIDGINPCAFTVAVFLISMLTYLGKNRGQVLAVGTGFASAVFVTYFLLGLGLLSAIKVFSVRSGVATGLAWAVGLGAIALGVWSLVDFVRYVRTRDVRTVTLGLPRRVKAAIHKVIRQGLRTPSLVLGSLAVGFLVAVLESVCTGQVYVPILMLLARRPGLRTHAVGYLLLYNVMFILPLLVILAAVYAGVSSERLGQFLRGHLGKIKLLLAVAFIGLGVLVLWTA